MTKKKLSPEKIRASIKAAKAEREAEREKLMKLPKSKIVEMYLTIRFHKVMTEQYLKPVLVRGLKYEKQIRVNQENAAKKKFDNGIKTFSALLTKNSIAVGSSTTAGQIEKFLSEKGVEQVPSTKTIRRYLPDLKKKGS